jgi:two-component system chemotaxis response regulator CheB
VIVQDETSSVIFGMPKAAVDVGAATHVVPDRDIPKTLVEVINSPPVPISAKGSP